MTLGVTIGPGGITAPSYSDILAALIASYQSIYGSDSDLDPDTQDGQLLAVFAQAINDCNQGAIAAYNAFSPLTAQGHGLESVVQINGLTRLSPSASTASVTVTGIAGTIITNGVVGDNANLGTRWDLPPTVTIPGGGSILVSATCEQLGAFNAGAGTLTQILTPTLGWQTVTNAAPATPGLPLESDAQLRQRQASSVALPGMSTEEAIYAAVRALPSIGRLQLYFNDTGSTDTNGVPAHSISVVAEGGVSTDIANQIALKKSPGTGTFGTTSVPTIDNHGIGNTINFFAMTPVPITVTITIKALAGFVSSTVTLIQSSVAYYINQLDIGEDSYLSRLYAPASLQGAASTAATGLSRTALDALSATYNITNDQLKQARSGSPLVQDVVIAFNEGATSNIGLIGVTIT